MCGRFYIEAEDMEDDLLAIIAEVQSRVAPEVELKTGEIFPTDVVPVIANDRAAQPRTFPMKWGFPRTAGGIVINARSETAAEKALFRESAAKRRCLIPASHYFEWEKSGREKRRYAIRPAGSKLLFLGGLYIVERQTRSAFFTVLTRPAAENIAFIHDRMPVIIPADKAADWLSPESDLPGLLRYAMENMEYREA